jgi:heterodisulfide reductase subunit C
MVDKVQEQVEALRRLANTPLQDCIQCGRCSAGCPVAFKMDLLPHRVVWELSQGNLETLLKATAPWQCVSCFACQNRCPRGVSPAAVMEALRLTAIRQQGANKYDAAQLENFDPELPQQALVAVFRKFNK